MDEDKQLEFTDLWNIIKKRMKLIIYTTMVVVVITGLINYCIIKPVYEAESSLIIGTSPEKGTALQDSKSIDIYMYQSLMKTYSNFASSQLVISSTAEKLKNTKTKEEILKNITVTVQEDTQIMTIKYRSTDPKEAKTTLDTLIESFITETQRIYPTDSINVMDKADIPKHPVKPNKIFNIAVAFFLGLTSSIFIAFLMELMNNTVKSQKDIEKYLKIAVLGTIPGNVDFTFLKNTKSLAFETYRILKNNIEFSSCDKKIRSVAIMSPESGEGKTTIASNLAVAFSEEGSNTILIDCNLRNPKLHEIFGLPKAKGLSEFLESDIDYHQVIKATAIQNLYLITSGSSNRNPSELIASWRMNNLMEALKEQFHYIIIDTPEVLMFSDTQILTQYCDGCVMLISANLSKRTATIKAKELLLKVNSKIIGAVLNEGLVISKESVWHKKFGGIHLIGKHFKLKI